MGAALVSIYHRQLIPMNTVFAPGKATTPNEVFRGDTYSCHGRPILIRSVRVGRVPKQRRNRRRSLGSIGLWCTYILSNATCLGEMLTLDKSSVLSGLALILGIVIILRARRAQKNPPPKIEIEAKTEIGPRQERPIPQSNYSSHRERPYSYTQYSTSMDSAGSNVTTAGNQSPAPAYYQSIQATQQAISMQTLAGLVPQPNGSSDAQGAPVYSSTIASPASQPRMGYGRQQAGCRPMRYSASHSTLGSTFSIPEESVR
ncbi:hypothetical protein BT63DRAFT_264844 [Microthyrium microscopicum]|uniref:Uncharacterized protein n=1 Tax=Microthyrium microscopicum TaxID=703497 RepID=A0A6A6UDT0_9PEZI|nr:hypothetical protein BT63DRAFT_264844 [Microthyrium microscopicum]